MVNLTVKYYTYTNYGFNNQQLESSSVPVENTYVVPGATLTLFFTTPDNTGAGALNPSYGTFDAPGVPSTSGPASFVGWGIFDPAGSTPYAPSTTYNYNTPIDVYQLWQDAGSPVVNTDIHLYPIYGGGPPICFKEDSEILTYDEAADKEEYVKVQDLRKGVLVKTLRSGYVPVKIATTSKVYNPGNGKRSEHCLFRCPTSVFPELKEDLIITGHHSILVDNLTEEQINEIQDTYGRVYITEKKYRLPAFIDERTVPYEQEGTFNICHFALENNNVKANYGVYANGGLVFESANECRLREKSGHTIISE